MIQKVVYRERKKQRQRKRKKEVKRDSQKDRNSRDHHLMDKPALVFNLGMIYYSLSYKIYLRIKKTSTPGYQ